MAEKKPYPLQREGLARDKRMPAALAPDFVQIDERDLQAHMDLVGSIAEDLIFYNLNFQPEGKWQPILEKDLSVVLARIASHELEEDFAEFNGFVSSFEITPLEATVLKMLNLNLKLLRLLNDWMVKTKSAPSFQRVFSELLDSGLNKASLDLQKVNWELGTGTAHVSIPFHFLGEDWELHSPTTTSPPPNLASTVEEMQLVFGSLFQACTTIANLAKEEFSYSVFDRGDHPPHTALILAFMMLFRHVQAQMNQLGKRHLDYFFQDILQIRRQPTQPDEVHLLFQLAPQASPFLLPKGTSLKAGKDSEGNEVKFLMENDLVVNAASVDSLRTLHISDNKILASPVANSSDGFGKEWDEEDPSWHPFGNSTSGESLGAELGFAFGAQILSLAEGLRKVTISFKAEPNTVLSAELATHFEVNFSGETEWVAPSMVNVSASGRDLHFECLLNGDAPPIVAYSNQLTGAPIPSTLPVARFSLNGSSDHETWLHFREIRFEEIRVSVDVRTVTSLKGQNDHGPLNLAKPFYPFGPSPVAGNSFYIGNAEAFSKKLDQLTLHFRWLDVPANLGEHYSAYLGPGPAPLISNNLNFTAKLHLLDNFFWHDIGANQVQKRCSQVHAIQQLQQPEAETEDQSENAGARTAIPFEEAQPQTSSFRAIDAPIYQERDDHGFSQPLLVAQYANALFDEDDARKSAKIEADPRKLSQLQQDDHEPIKQLPEYNPRLKRGYLRLELLCPDFQHKDYLELYTKEIIRVTKESADPPEPNLPAQPISPQLAEIHLDYQASETLSTESQNFFQLNPFGTTPVKPEIGKLLLVPRFNVAPDTSTPMEGALLIGIKKGKPLETITLLFEFKEGSQDPEQPTPKIHWSYLSSNQWKTLPGKHLISDSTQQLQTTGIITFQLPRDATSTDSRIETGLHWLRASISQNTKAAPRLKSVWAQAGIGVYQIANRSNDRLAQPLPPNTVEGLVKHKNAIRSVQQPLPSFGGKVSEEDKPYYMRVSERLRHKDRALNIWDFEHLVLEHFPSVYKVKCLSHSSPNSFLHPGHVRLVVVPDARNVRQEDLLTPRISTPKLDQIKAMLRERCSPWLELSVVNPKYETLEIEASIAFNVGYDALFYQQKLSEELRAFLSPWAYEGGQEISFENKIYKSVLLDFIDELEYVNYVTELKMFHVANGQRSGNQRTVIPSTAASILVSARQHRIHIVE